MAQRIIFVVDSSPDGALISTLEKHGFEVSTQTASAILAKALITDPPDLVMIDVSDALEGIELLKRIRASYDPKKTMILVSAEWGTGQGTLALANGADAFEPKPTDGASMTATVERLLRPRLVMAANASEE